MNYFYIQDAPMEQIICNLGDNYPNPFNQKTLIPYSIPENTIGAINIYESREIRVKSIPLNTVKKETELEIQNS